MLNVKKIWESVRHSINRWNLAYFPLSRQEAEQDVENNYCHHSFLLQLLELQANSSWVTQPSFYHRYHHQTGFFCLCTCHINWFNEFACYTHSCTHQHMPCHTFLIWNVQQKYTHMIHMFSKTSKDIRDPLLSVWFIFLTCTWSTTEFSHLLL